MILTFFFGMKQIVHMVYSAVIFCCYCVYQLYLESDLHVLIDVLHDRYQMDGMAHCCSV